MSSGVSARMIKEIYSRTLMPGFTYLLKGVFKNIPAGLGDRIDITKITKRICQDYIANKLNYAVSLFIANYNLKNGSLQYVTSNFPNPVLLTDGRIETLPSLDNPIIDASHFDHPRNFQVGVAQLRPGARVFAFTDGAFEFRTPKGKEFGMKKFAHLLFENQNWTSAVEEGLESARGDIAFEDDISILCLSRDSV